MNMPELEQLLRAIKGERPGISRAQIVAALGGDKAPVGDFVVEAIEKRGVGCVRVHHPLLIKSKRVVPTDIETLNVLMRELAIHDFTIKAMQRLDLTFIQMEQQDNLTSLRLLDTARTMHVHLIAQTLTQDKDVTIKSEDGDKVYPQSELFGGVGVAAEHTIILGDGTGKRLNLNGERIEARGNLIRNCEIGKEPSNEFMFSLANSLRMSLAASAAKSAMLVTNTRTPPSLGVTREESVRAMAGALLEVHPLCLTAEKLEGSLWGFRNPSNGEGIMLDENDQTWRKVWPS